MKKLFFIIFCLLLITLPNFVCYAEQETSIPSDAILFNLELLQEGAFPETTIIEEDSKHIDENIRQALYNKVNTIEVEFSGNDNELANLYECVINDAPMLFYVSGSVYISRIDDNNYNIYPQYKESSSNGITLFAASNPIETAINDILAQVSNEMSDVEKILAVHDYMLTHYEYDYTYSYYYADEFFTHKRGVCNAYALSFKYIMERIGIECFVVTSDAMNHAWNVVCVDGNYYHIDATWDDGFWDELGRVKHSYFMLSDQAMSDSDHNHYGWSGSVKATDTKYDSYVWSDFESPMQYYDGYWYTAQSGEIYQCSIQNNTKTKLGIGEEIGIYKEIMYITDSTYNLYTIPMDKITNFKPVLNDRLKNLQSLERLNGVLIEDGLFKYAIADDEFYEYEYQDDDLPHAIYDNYYEYRYFYSVDLTEYKDTYRIGDNITWTVDGNGTLNIHGIGDMYNSAENNSFLGYYTDEIKSAIIENGVTTIGDYAFYNCVRIESVTIPESVTTIGCRAFYDCIALTNISWNAKNVVDFSSDNQIFANAGNGVEGINVVFGDNVEYIPAYAFYPSTSNVPKIASITIGENVTEIGYGAFYNCTFLTEINWNAKNCADFTYKDDVFMYAGESGDGINVLFGDIVERIPSNLFYSCSSKIINIAIGSNVKSIGDSAFHNCTGLTSITIPESVEIVEQGAFNGCASLSQINWNAKNCADFHHASSVFSNAGQNGDGIGVIFGDTVEKIPAYMFHTGNYPGYVKPNITSVTIGENVKSIGKSAFYNCTELISITIPSSVETIGFSAFFNCISLSQINWNAKNCADFIDKYNYYYENTGVFLFAGQKGDGISVIFGDMVEKIPAYIFHTSGADSTPKIVSVIIGSNVKSIGENAFCKCTELKNLTIGNSVEHIGGSAFYNCTGLTDINIPDSIKNIGGVAFYNCTELENLTIGNSVESIGTSAFYNCESLSQINWNAINCADFTYNANDVFMYAGESGDGINVTFGDMVKKIPSYLFYGISQITSISIGNSVQSIGDYAFYNCTGITSLIIPDSVKSIGGNAFCKCTELKNLTIGNSVESIGMGAFYNCESLSQINWNAINCADFTYNDFPFAYAGQNGDGINVIFGDTVEKIPSYIFYDTGTYATKLTRITIGSRVQSIGENAFYNCTGITSLIIPDSIKSIGERAFYNCTGLENLTIGNSVESIGGSAFYNCKSLTQINWNAKNCADFTYGMFPFAGQNGEGINVIFGDMVKKIPAYIFFEGADSDRAKITSVNIGTNVKSIGEYAFNNCTASITIRSNVEYVGDYAFCGCTGLTNITVSNGFTDIESEVIIGEFAFAFCNNLTEITIGNGLKSIGYEAFYDCSRLLDVYYNGNKDKWNEISIGKFNELLTNATKHYFVYVTLLDKNGNEITKATQSTGDILDTSIINVPSDSSMELYSDKEYTTVFDINTPINENIILYAVEIKLNDIAIVGVKNVDVDENGFSQKVTFVTDKEAKYFVCTVKYPINLILTKITSEDFEIEQDSETVGEYNYLYLTCIYNGDGNLPVNIIQSPFELVFDISENIVANDILTVEMLDDAILADDNGNSYTFSNIENAEVRINQILVTGITIVGEDEVNSETNYTASVSPQNATRKTVKWSVSDETIATISQDGVLTPIKTGSVTIRATTQDGSGVFAEKNISVTVPVAVKDITITGANEVYNIPCYYTASVSPADADDKSVEWSISDETIATISQEGKLIPIKTGTVTIRATAKDESGVFAEKTVLVIVVKKVTNISIIGADNIESETTYMVSVLPEDADNKNVEWSVSDETIATISQDGTLTPLKTGNVTIKAIAKDGSGVFTEKTVSVNVIATVTGITSNIGTWDSEYSSSHNNYIIYVPTSTTSIKLNAIHSGTLKSTDNKTFINNVAKTITLSSNQTVLTLSYTCEGYADNTYTITIIKFEGTKTKVSEDKKSFTITPINIENGKTVILALYNGEQFVEMQSKVYTGEAIPFTTTKAYTKAKVMFWDNFTSLKPVCDVESVK